MKSRLLSLAVSAAAAWILASCASYEEISGYDEVQKAGEELQSIELTFTATLEQPEETRTSLEQTSWKVKWENGDKIAVYAKCKGNIIGSTSYSGPASFSISTISSDGYTATFTGTIEAPSLYSITEFYAVYPYSSKASISDGTVSTALVAEQAAEASTFSGNVNLAAAKSTDKNNLQFKNLCALLSFTVDSDVVSATLSSNSNTGMSGGTAKIGFSSSTPSLTVSGAGPSVSLTGDMKKGTKYYFVVYPGTYDNGFTVKFKDKDGRTATLSSTKKLVLDAQDNVFLGNIAVPAEKWSQTVSITAIGVYDTDYNCKYEYQKYNDQLVWSVKSGVNGFRIQNTKTRKFISISGLPGTFTAGSTFDVDVKENLLTDQGSEFTETVMVVSTTDDSIISLEGNKYNYIIKKD